MILKPIDPKYSVAIELKNERNSIAITCAINIVKTATAEPIPDDEPLILFRARDRHALAMLGFYSWICEQDGCTDFHMEGIADRIKAFEEFRQAHPDRMKQPGVTRGL